MITRRRLLELGAAATLLPSACRRSERSSGPVVLNDIHSQLNATRVAEVRRPPGLDELVAAIREAAANGWSISNSGGRHSMGGQQFGTDTVNLDLRRMDRVLGFDPHAGTLEVEAGIQWPALVDWCLEHQRGRQLQWGIRQKQTGADRLTLGGALASNIHGRGLTMAPIVDDVESLTLVDGHGRVHRCSRQENPELFSRAIGGYGLFGVVYSLVLRLAPRQKLERVVEIRPIDGLAEAVEDRIAQGFLYGDFQFKTDEKADDFLEVGVFSCYRPVAGSTQMPRRQRRLPRSAWQQLLEWAHFDKARAYEEYSRYYLSTSGQIYWSDSHQMSEYFDDYHRRLDRKTGAGARATEMISELYVPRQRLAGFLRALARTLRQARANLIYGTVRLIERDEVTALAWARQPWACVVVNLHVEHSPAGIELAGEQFRLLIDLARAEGGSYFLTYHRWARRDQVESCYPEMVDFLGDKRNWDPDERFQSDWYRHYRDMFATDL